MLPESTKLYEVLDATWPAASMARVGPWTIREGAGGGKRVSAATAETAWTDGDIAEAGTNLRQEFGKVEIVAGKQQCSLGLDPVERVPALRQQLLSGQRLVEFLSMPHYHFQHDRSRFRTKTGIR